MGRDLFSLRIGEGRYRIRADDQYLRQGRRGVLPALDRGLRRLFGLDAFEPRMVRLFSSLISRGDTVLDVGANIGCMSLLFAQRAGRVVAFEPTPASFALWQDNVARSGHSNCQGHCLALGNEDKWAEIDFDPRNRSGAYVADLTAGRGARAAIQVQRLDALWPSLGLERLDVVKLDVEGYERRVIEGAWATLDRHRPVLQMELNAWCLNVMQRTALPDFLDFLLERFPIVYAIERQQYVDLRDHSGRWQVMEANALRRRFKELVLAFDPARLEHFRACYRPLPR